MRVYISADIEGVAGVVVPAQGQAGHVEYEKARILMTEEVNAVVEGLVEAGATEILVNDSHGPMTNILPSLLHPAADLLLGKPKPMNMACGLTAEFDLFLMVGHHSMAGKGGVLAHTTNGFAFREVRINNLPYGEPGIYGAYAGELGVPVGLVSGDDCTRDENIGFFPDAEFVVVKQSFGHRAARQVSVQRARAMLREGRYVQSAKLVVKSIPAEWAIQDGILDEQCGTRRSNGNTPRPDGLMPSPWGSIV